MTNIYFSEPKNFSSHHQKMVVEERTKEVEKSGLGLISSGYCVTCNSEVMLKNYPETQ